MKQKRGLYVLAVVVVLAIVAALVFWPKQEEESVGESPVHTVDDLAGASIGVQIGTIGDIYASDYEAEGSTIARYTKGADAIQALKQGKVDCVIIDEQPANAFVERNSDLSILSEEFAVEEYAICIAKENTELLDEVNAAIQTLKDNGTLEKIIQNYIGDSTKGQYPYESPDVDRSNGELVIATNATFEPYEYVDNGEIVGIDIDMSQAIADELGMELVVQDMEFDSIISAVQTGKADMGVAGLTVTEDRLKSINFTDSYTTSTQVIIVRNGTVAKTLSFSERIYENFVKNDRWQNLTQGLLNTIKISFVAVLIGISLGFLIAVLRATCDMTGKYAPLNWLLKAYLTVVRGTPVMVQLLIIYYVIFASTSYPVMVACLAFGLNSSAYVAEIVRGGIMSIDPGQFEAGRSLGFSYAQTMWHFILPQAFKNVLPALGNEFIVLLKETSISGYIGIVDLTRGGDYIRSRTYDAFMPLIAVALIYLIIVMGLSKLVSMMEARLKNDGRN